MNNYPEKIYDLLENASFESLSASDRNFVLQHLTMEEYKQMQALWSKAQDVPDLGTTADPAILKSLQTAFEREHKKTIPFWKQNIPVYKAAAAILIPVLATVLYYEQFRVKNTPEGVLSIADTVFVKGPVDTVFIKELQKPEVKTTVIRVQTIEKEELHGSVPLSADSTYRELTSGII